MVDSIVIIDRHTRNYCSSVSFDSIQKHATILTNLSELSTSHMGCKLIVFATGIPYAFTYELLSEYVSAYKLDCYLFHDREDASLCQGSGIKLVEADYGRLDWTLIDAGVTGDTNILESYLSGVAHTIPIESILSDVGDQSRDAVRNLYNSYISMVSYTHKLSESSDRLQHRLQTYDTIYKKCRQLIDSLNSELLKVTRENNELTALFSKSYSGVFDGVYPNRPRIIYINTVSHLSGIDNLILSLHTVLTTQYRISCKVLKLVDGSYASQVRYIPNSYLLLNDTYETGDILGSDLIASLGGYQMLLDYLLLNRSGLDVLIVHDCHAKTTPILSDRLVDLLLHEVSSDYAVLGEYSNLLSDLDSASYLWDFKTLATYTGTKSAKLVNHPTVGKILSSIL